MAETLFSRLTAEEKRRALDLDDLFLQSVLKSRHGGMAVVGLGVEEELALAARMSDGDIQQAIEIVEWHKQALAASESDEHQTAIEYFEKIVRQAPFDAISWMSLGVQHAFLRNGRKAVDCLERALSEDPDNERIRGNLEAVRADFAIVESVRPIETPVKSALDTETTPESLQRAESGASTLATQHYWQRNDAHDGRVQGWTLCACCHTKRLEVNQGVVVRPWTIADVVGKVTVTELTKRFQAERVARATLSLQSLATSATRLGTESSHGWAELEEQAHALLVDESDDTRLLLALGVIQFRQNKLEEALATFEVCRQCAPGDPVIHFHCGKVHESLGRLEVARRFYDRAWRMDPWSVAARSAFRRLDARLMDELRRSNAPPSLSAENTDTIRQMLDNKDFDAILACGESAVEPLIAVLKQNGPTRGGDAAFDVKALLVRLGPTSAQAITANLWKNQETFEVQPSLVEALGLIGGSAVVRYLLRVLEAMRPVRPVPASLPAVIAALLWTADAEASRVLLDMLQSDVIEHRNAVLSALSQHGPFECVPRTFFGFPEVMLRDEGLVSGIVDLMSIPDIQRDGAFALARTSAADAPRHVAQVLSHRDPGVRQSAAEVLGWLARRQLPIAWTGHEVRDAVKRGDVWDASTWVESGGVIERLLGAALDQEATDNFRQSAAHSLGACGLLILPALHQAARQASRNGQADSWSALLTRLRQFMPESAQGVISRLGALRENAEVQTLSHVAQVAAGAFPGDAFVLTEPPANGLHDSTLYSHSACPSIRVSSDLSPRQWKWDNDRMESSNMICGADSSDIKLQAEFRRVRWSPSDFHPSGALASQTPGAELAQLNQSLKAAWQGLQYSASPCDVCGILMPNQDANDAMGINALLAFQKSGQAVLALLSICHTYLGNVEILQETLKSLADNPKNGMLIALTLVDRFRLLKCERCGAQVCKKCVKLPHDAGGCVICTAKRKREETLPRLVCKNCADTLQLSRWNGALPAEETPQ